MIGLLPALLALHLVAAGQIAEAPPAHSPDAAAADLARLEAAVAADPEDLRAASDYRKAVIRAGQYDRCLAFFDKLTAAHPQAANAWLNYGYAFVDKIPAAGSITQVILANNALKQFTRAIEIRKSWLALFTRGNSYLYWPKVFNRAALGVADLEEAVALARAEAKPKRVYVRSFVALGDGFWKTDQPEKARAVWKEGLERFPGDAQLQARLDREGDALAAYIEEQLDPNKRVDTDLDPLLEGD